MGDLSREPSMEDILSSIRRVIARDEAPGSARELPDGDDILDLQAEQAPEADAAEPAEGEELVSTRSADAARQSLEALSAAITPASAASARSEEHTSELQSLMRISSAVFCLKNKKQNRL